MGVAKTAGALMAGCSVILKPSPEGALHVEVLAEAYAAAGFPAGVVNVLPGGGEAGARLVGHPDVDMVTFTGSTAAGRAIATSCARNRSEEHTSELQSLIRISYAAFCLKNKIH